MKKIDPKNYEKPSKFFKASQGDNRIRLLSDGYIYYVVGKPTAKGFVRAIIEDGQDLPKFLEDAEPKLTYGWIVYDFNSNQLKVLETGTMLGDQLARLTAEKPDDEYKAFDIIVNRTGEKLKTEYTARWADERHKLPEGLSNKSPEYKVLARHFQPKKEK